MLAFIAETPAVSVRRPLIGWLKAAGTILAFTGFMILAGGAILLASTYEAGALTEGFDFEAGFGRAYTMFGVGKMLVGGAFLVTLTAIVGAKPEGGEDNGPGKTSRWMLIFGGVLIPIGYYLTATSNRPAIELYLRARYTTEAVGLQLEGLGYVFLAIGFSICLASMPSLGGRSRRPSDETSYHGGKESPGPGVPPR